MYTVAIQAHACVVLFLQESQISMGVVTKSVNELQYLIPMSYTSKKMMLPLEKVWVTPHPQELVNNWILTCQPPRVTSGKKLSMVSSFDACLSKCMSSTSSSTSKDEWLDTIIVWLWVKGKPGSTLVPVSFNIINQLVKSLSLSLSHTHTTKLQKLLIYIGSTVWLTPSIF